MISYKLELKLLFFHWEIPVVLLPLACSCSAVELQFIDNCITTLQSKHLNTYWLLCTTELNTGAPQNDNNDMR